MPGNKHNHADGTGNSLTYTTLDECAAKCDSDPDCLGFQDNSASGEQTCIWKSLEYALTDNSSNDNCYSHYYRKPSESKKFRVLKFLLNKTQMTLG